MLQAIGKHVIVKPIYALVKEKIILTSKDPSPIHYEVKSVGEEVKSISVGDKIPYPQYTNQTVEHEGEKLFFINLENITSIIV